MSQAPIWWEKTVEYQFVLQSRDAGFDLAIPLSGVQERGGDAVFGSQSQFMLVEFKHSTGTLASEQEKFKGRFDEAKAALQTQGRHHVLIYGDLQDQVLYLSCLPYWDTQTTPQRLTDQTVFKALTGLGTTKTDFDDYLEKLIAFKPADKRSSGSGGISFGHVLGVDTTASRCACISLDEYHRIHAPQLNLNQSLDLDRQVDRGFSPGM